MLPERLELSRLSTMGLKPIVAAITPKERILNTNHCTSFCQAHPVGLEPTFELYATKD